jgi:hypothetical protein
LVQKAEPESLRSAELSANKFSPTTDALFEPNIEPNSRRISVILIERVSEVQIHPSPPASLRFSRSLQRSRKYSACSRILFDLRAPEELSFSREQLIACAILSVENRAGALLHRWGWLLDRIEARFVMGAGATFAVLGLLSASRSNSFESLLLSVLLLGFGLGASTWLAASTVIANWFLDRHGFALGIVTAGMEAGGMLMTFIVGSVIAAYSWRAGYFTVAIPGLLIVVPLLVVFIRTRPAEVSREFTADKPESVLPGFEVREAVRTRAFRMLVVAQLAYGLAVGGTFHHLVAFLEGLGYNLHSATLVVSIVLGMAAVGKAAMGRWATVLAAKMHSHLALL